MSFGAHPSRSVFDPLAVQAAATLHTAGHQAVFAGGCVRDALLGRPPQDVDIATDARPDDVARLFPGSKFIGKSFGVTLVPVGDRHFEVATFRRDLGGTDGRHPDAIEFARAEDDAGRRDFTINGLFYDPATERVIDHVGGLADLQRRVVRAIGDPRARFLEDHLRMLRAVRFAAVLEFELDPDTAEAIRRDAAAIGRISAERILQEVTRLLTEAPAPGRGLRLLREVGLLAQILPEVDAMAGVQQPPEFHPEGDVFVHTALALDQLRAPDAALAWSVLLHDVGKPPTFRQDPAEKNGRIRFEGHAGVGARMADEIMRRLRASNELREAVETAVRQHMRFVDWPRMKTSTRRRMVAHPLFPLELELHRADCMASHGLLDTYAAARAEYEQFRAEPRLPAPLLNGRDLMALGVPEGPEVGRWRRVAFDAQLEGRFATREAGLAWIANAIKQRTEASDEASPNPPPPGPATDSSA
ncbi:MAG TPA: CCA tRNA nucleotidyltransferase [Kiritimatiellia bacterium]|nr:CCA tRNA nucleotidyltransferase [Kiritimatiellia bacterium]